MNERIVHGRKLKTGYTTGTCAAAASKAAVAMLLAQRPVESVAVTTLSGVALTLAVHDASFNGTHARCAIVKDAGDDPDVTHGAKIFADVVKTESGITVDGGAGVGRATKPGLKVAVGQAAINPGPMEMIRRAVSEAVAKVGYTGGISVVISVPGGEALAKKTMNARLGIDGGISILGSTGVVEPMSDAAVIGTIRAEMDMMRAAGKQEIIVTPGNYGRDFARNALGLDMDEGAVKCSNFLGETLDYAVLAGVSSIQLIGHAGKLVKVAGGIMNTYSKVADCRMEIVAAHAAMADADKEVIAGIMRCVTIDAAIEILKASGVNEAVWQSIGKKIAFHLKERVHGAIGIRFVVFTEAEGILVQGLTT